MGFDESDDGIVNHRGGLKGIKDRKRPLILLGAAAAATALVVVVGLVFQGSRRNSPEQAVASFLTLIRDGKCEEAMELMSSGARRWVSSVW